MPSDAERQTALQRFADDFARGAYWDAHEHLEELWRSERLTVWQALIQLAATFVLLEGDRLGGARSVLSRARSKLDHAPARLHGVEVAWLRERLDALSSALVPETSADVHSLARMFDDLHGRLGLKPP